jgi:hypothetical protein
MSDGKVSYIIALKDLATSGLRKISAGLGHVAGGVKRLAGMSLSGLTSSFRRLSVVAAGTAAGLVYYAARASKAWLDKTQSLGEVRRALEVTGQATDTNAKKLGQLSDWLQTTANVADDAGDAAIAYALRLGVGANEMDSFMKAALSLSKVIGSDLIGGVRQLVRAQAGSTEMLARYGIVLDQTKSKEEQYLDLKAKMLKMFDDGIASVNDAGSKWENFKHRVADVTKALGMNLVEGLKLERVIDMLRGGATKLIDALQKPDNPFRVWVEDVRNLAVDLAAVLKALSTAEGRRNLGKDMADLFTAGVADAGSMFMDAMGMAVSLLVKAAPVIGTIIRDKIMEAWTKRNERKEMIEGIGNREALNAWEKMPEWQRRSLQKQKGGPFGGGVESEEDTMWRFRKDYGKTHAAEIEELARKQMMEDALKEGADLAGQMGGAQPARKSRTEEVWERIRGNSAVSKARGDLERQAAELEALGKETPDAPDFSDVTGPSGAAPAAAASRTASGGGGFDFLDHARALGTEIKEWKPGEKTMTDLYTVMEGVERNTRDVSKLLEQE